MSGCLSVDRTRVSRATISCLLVIAMMTVVLFGTPYSNSYPQATTVSQTITLTSTTVVSQSTVFYSLPYGVGSADNHTCQINDLLSFNATQGQDASIAFTTSGSVGFYVIPEANYTTWYNTPGCTGHGFQIAGADGTGLSYSVNFTIPEDGSYRLVFVNYSQTPASLTFSMTLNQIAVTTITTLYIPSPASTSSYSVTSQASSNTIDLMGPAGLIIVVAIALVGAFLVFSRRRKSARGAALEAPKPVPIQSTEPSIPTGYQKLDGMLAGGLPEGYAIVIVSQSYDESDLLVRKVLESGVASGRPTFYLSNDIARIRDSTGRLGNALFVLSPIADKIASERGSVMKIPDVGDLSNLNISLTEIIEAKSGNAASKLIVFDLLSDLLLRNKVINTRRWLSDFIARRKAAGFTILATLNPSVASKEDVQTIVGVFDGVIEVFEKPLQERTRRFLVIKKMFGRDYSEDEVMLDRQELLQSDKKQ